MPAPGTSISCFKGKSYVTFTGDVSDVDAATSSGAEDAERAGMLVRHVVIPQPHTDMAGVLAEMWGRVSP